MNDWFVKINNAEHGPLTSERLKQLAQQGKVTPDTPVRKGQAGTWLKASSVKGLPFSTPTPEPDVLDDPIVLDGSKDRQSSKATRARRHLNPMLHAQVRPPNRLRVSVLYRIPLRRQFRLGLCILKEPKRKSIRWISWAG